MVVMKTLLLDVMDDPVSPGIRYILLWDVGITLFGCTCKSKAFVFERIDPTIERELKNTIKL